jgi:hypothetical protein
MWYPPFTCEVGTNHVVCLRHLSALQARKLAAELSILTNLAEMSGSDSEKTQTKLYAFFKKICGLCPAL